MIRSSIKSKARSPRARPRLLATIPGRKNGGLASTALSQLLAAADESVTRELSRPRPPRDGRGGGDVGRGGPRRRPTSAENPAEVSSPRFARLRRPTGSASHARLLVRHAAGGAVATGGGRAGGAAEAAAGARGDGPSRGSGPPTPRGAGGVPGRGEAAPTIRR